LALLIAAAPASAADIRALKRAILEKDWPQAEAELVRLAGEPELDRVELLFLEGMMALERGQYERSIEAFRRILLSRPDLVRVRLELGRALFLKGDDEAAQFHFERALSSNMPQPVADNIRGYLAQIRRRRDWSLDVALGFVSDSNANAGSRIESVTLGGLEFRLNPDARPQRARGLSFALDARRRYAVGEGARLLAWSSLAGRELEGGDHDDILVRAGAAFAWLDTDYELSLGPVLSYRAHAQRGYTRAAGLRADANRRLSQRWLADASIEISRQTDLRGRDLDGPLLWVSGRAFRTLDAQSMLSLGLDYLREDTRADALRYREAAMALGYHRDGRHGLSYAVILACAVAAYDNEQPLFEAERTDHRLSATLNLAKRNVHGLGFMPVLSLTRAENRSSIGFFSYGRTLVRLLAQRRF
jgi:tetratricopeptide (TPR) repeat protein